uniref:Uncharacterized protein n=1 Tax=viral metagenome TaxID=1070528 RepID=A0A6M3LV07_9ZZZZ
MRPLWSYWEGSEPANTVWTMQSEGEMNFITEYDLSLFEVDDACPLCGERLEITGNIVFCGCCGCGKDRREKNNG